MAAAAVERWTCTADGLRLERACRDRFRNGGDASRPLSNKLLRAAIKTGEVTIDGVVVLDKARVLRAGQTVELQYGLERAAAEHAAAADRVDFEHVDSHVAVVWKPAGANRAFEEALASQLPASAEPDAQDMALMYRLSKGVPGLLVAARTVTACDALLRQRQACGAEEHSMLRCRFRAVVYGRMKFADASRGLQRLCCPAAAAQAEQGPPDGGVGVVSAETVTVTRSPSAGHLSIVDLWCSVGSSGGRHRCTAFH